jgi:transposase
LSAQINKSDRNDARGIAQMAMIIEPLLIARRVLREQLGVLHRQLLEIVRHDEVCRRLMTTPGVGPVVALTFRASVDVPSRFTNSKAPWKTGQSSTSHC